jgi:hypothetical protein
VPDLKERVRYFAVALQQLSHQLQARGPDRDAQPGRGPWQPLFFQGGDGPAQVHASAAQGAEVRAQRKDSGATCGRRSVSQRQLDSVTRLTCLTVAAMGACGMHLNHRGWMPHSTEIAVQMRSSWGSYRHSCDVFIFHRQLISTTVVNSIIRF